MKKVLLVFTVVFIALSFGSYTDTNSNSSVPPTQRTGAPGEGNCTGCHSGALGTTGVTLVIAGMPTNYVLGSVYSLTASVNDASMPMAGKRGFQVTCLTAGGASAGTFINLSGATVINAGGGKSYLSHNTASATSTFNFQWTAPATNVGAVTFHYIGVHSNNSFSSAGDKTHNGSLTIAAPVAVASCVLGCMSSDLATTFQTSECSGNVLNLTCFITPASPVLGVDYTLVWERSVNFGAWTVEAGATALTYSPVLPAASSCSGTSVRYRPNITSCGTTITPGSGSNTTVYNNPVAADFVLPSGCNTIINLVGTCSSLQSVWYSTVSATGPWSASAPVPTDGLVVYYQVRALTGPGSPAVACGTSGFFTVACGVSTFDVTGVLFGDMNGNTTLEMGSEPYLTGGVVVIYADANGNGIFDAGEVAVSTATADASGAISANLPAGDYVLVVVSTSNTSYGLPIDNNLGFAIATSTVSLSVPCPLIVGINEHQNNALLSCVNPVGDVLMFAFASEIQTKGTIQILNLRGEIVIENVLTLSAGLSPLSVDVARLVAGVYLVKVTNNSGTSSIQKIIKY